MRYSITILALATSVFAAPVEKRQSNSTDVSSSQNSQSINNNLDLSNGQFNANGLDFSNIDANSLGLNDFNVQDILNGLSFQILEQELLGSNNNNVNSLSSFNLGNVQDFSYNQFQLSGFNDLFGSSFNVDSIFQLLEGLNNNNVFDQNNLLENNGIANLNEFSNGFNEQFQSSWQSNEVLALIESLSGQQSLEQLADLAGLSNNGFSNSNFGGNSNIAVAQIETITI